ncbi:hypothetical protein [Phaeodactylibacter luteus]|uniref:Alginate export domain-containing protein n=1 Tax=Phaeodactylibacter luteus TaxID=1564516 RepID=A0A5C6RJ94_9BACT|nr:hypothetical protein [Phaeodactylibacter luteus]TXB62496.1 hypothetical protein FRY97_13985 [Phaeodactylibacter luteus]
MRYGAKIGATALLLALGILSLCAQEAEPRSWSVNGYLKQMQALLFFKDAYPSLQQGQLVDTFLQDNLIHHRLNFRWQPAKHLRVRADLRTRIFYGDLVRATPDYGAAIDDVNNDYFDWSAVLFSQGAWAMHTMLDRAYVEYGKGALEVRLGRQRINWGISTVWNPNDVFNAFAFTDFDYEERPGSDALRLKYYTGFASSLELAANVFDDWSSAVIAGLWKFNHWAYDFQLMGGYARGDWVIGGGWAGNLGNAGLKGEGTLFVPSGGGRTALAATVGVDYAFPNAVYSSLGYLYNSEGQTEGTITGLFDFELSARNLYPYRHALFGQSGYPVTPLFNAGLAVIYSPVRAHALFINPTLTYSLGQNWDLDMVGQLAFDREEGRFQGPLQALFLRLKWSY